MVADSDAVLADVRFGPPPCAAPATPAEANGILVIRTPDGRYIVVRGRLWRAANPHLPNEDRDRLVHALMAARRQLRGESSAEDRAAARAAVDAAKVALGERGPVWWSDGAPDLNRRLVGNTPYASWFATLSAE